MITMNLVILCQELSILRRIAKANKNPSTRLPWACQFAASSRAARWFSLAALLFIAPASLVFAQEPPGDLESLRESLKSKDPLARRSALEALTRTELAFDALAPDILEAVRNDPWGSGRAAASALARVSPEGARLALEAASFESQFPLTGFKRAKETVFSENGEALFWLALAFERMSTEARAELSKARRAGTGIKSLNAAVISLWLAVDAQEPYGSIKEMIRSEVPAVRRSAARAIAKLGATAQDSAPGLILIATDADPTVRAAALDALGRICPAESVGSEARRGAIAASLARALTEDSAEICRDLCARSVERARLCTPELLAALAKACADPSEAVIASTLRALEALAEKASSLQSSIQGCLRRPELEAETRVLALEAIASQGPAAAPLIDDLLAALADPSREIQAAAALAIGRARAAPEKSLPALGKALTDAPESVSQAALRAITEFGPAAAPALPDIAKALKRGRILALSSLEALESLSPIPPQAPQEELERGLLDLLKSPEPILRAGAASALALISSSKPESALAVESALSAIILQSREREDVYSAAIQCSWLRNPAMMTELAERLAQSTEPSLASRFDLALTRLLELAPGLRQAASNTLRTWLQAMVQKYPDKKERISEILQKLPDPRPTPP